MKITDLINTKLISLNLVSKTKSELFAELADLLLAEKKISNKSQFLKDIEARESIDNTGFENGIALPHAKSESVLSPAVAIGISREGINYGAEDGKPSKFFFMIASPSGNANHHVEVLAQLSAKLIEDGFIDKLHQAKTSAEVLALFLSKNKAHTLVDSHSSKGFLIGVTGCPTGIAHTYLAADALKKGAAELGYHIKVETNGSVGVKDKPTLEEIEKAEAVIVCCDKQVDITRFSGKKLIETGVKAPIKDAISVIKQALNAPIYHEGHKTQMPPTNITKGGSNLYKYLMNGVSHMIPFVVTGGLLIALSLAIGGEPTSAGMSIPNGSLWQKVLDIGVVAFTLMIPILAGYIAYAIGDRPALAPGFIGGWIANNGSFYDAPAGTGFIGAIIAGLLVGYFVKWLISIHYHKFLQPLVPIMIAPILGSLFIATLFIFGIGSPIAGMMASLTDMLTELSTGNFVLLGIVLGGLAGFDMGGPFNKVAFLFSVGMIASGQTQFMGAMACAIPVAPLGMSIATVIGRQFHIFEEEELEAGKAAGAMGLVGISEGAIPFAAQDPLSVIPANVLGSMVAAVLAFMFGITNAVAHGGPVVALLGAVNKPIIALLCMLIGAIVTAIICITLKKVRQANKLASSNNY